MKNIAFIDLEIQPTSGAVLDIGGINSAENVFHSKSLKDFVHFLEGTEYLCGHNIFKHDLKYIIYIIKKNDLPIRNVIDTLYLSALLFPRKPYHSLIKDEKLQVDELNNPVNDSKKVKELLTDEVLAFNKLDDSLQQVFFLLLNDQKEFRSFFRYVGYKKITEDAVPLIKKIFTSEICDNSNLNRFVVEHPIALAYALAIINAKDRFSITPPWILKNYPEVDWIMDQLRNRPCLYGCAYCHKALDARLGLKRFFGFDSYRTFGGEPLQEKAVQAAIDNKSLLAIFPTGGGKSLTFQVPALMSGENTKGITVVISPLQSLMKDQVDNLEKAGITDAVTINGLLDPIERANSIDRIQDGSASILYISPESLRSRTIENSLLGRKIVRFVIDEAHCFSAWGQDFRVDYMYIGDFIKALQKQKNLEEGIPVSCFTATAKQKVIEDIQVYFKEKLAIDLEIFNSSATRSNLRYKVIEKLGKEKKYPTLRGLIEQRDCPTIVYVSRTKEAYDLAERLTKDGFLAKPYHGKMDKKEKSENQEAFIAGEVPIMVATSAFGMGVDKKDVGMVIHYEISDSLENYIQEAGRAGRDETITADCYVLFCEDDLDKHFTLLNQTKMNIKEIQQVWKAIKDLTRFRMTVSQSALEIARKAGWDESIEAIETRVKIAIAALEESGYIRRGQNMPRVYADSILCKNAEDAIAKINASRFLNNNEKENAIRIIKFLIANRSRSKAQSQDAESRVDYISDRLGIEKKEVIGVINILREEEILSDSKDLMAYIKKSDNVNRSLQIFHTYRSIEKYLAEVIEEEEATYNIKELNEEAEKNECKNVTPNKILTILNYWSIKKMVKFKILDYSKNHIRLVRLETKDKFLEVLEKRQLLAEFVIDYLYSQVSQSNEEDEKEEKLVIFSIIDLKKAYKQSMFMHESETNITDIEDTLLYLSRIGAIKIEGGFLVVYNPMTIERLEEDTKRRYKTEDYKKLSEFYDNRVKQIHIVGEYAKKMINNYREALQFVEDYFGMNYNSFLRKYFKGSREKDIGQNISPGKFKQLFGELSPTQLSIIKDDKNQYISVLAGPGSGKTRVLVHKLASLILMEDVKHEQLLMLTFSRAAATEFKKRLIGLIGNAANYIEIKTFHSYCFDLLGSVGDVDKFDQVIRNTIISIRNGEVEKSRITKTVLVIDEAQDMDEEIFGLVQALMEQNEEMRVILVGDDDQNIFEFRGSCAKHMKDFIIANQAATYELLENYRSKRNLVDFSNQFVPLIRERLKKNEIVAHKQDDGDIRIIQYANNNLLVPFVKDLSILDLAGSTCVLTYTNDEALQVTGMLMQQGIPARLIQTNEGFKLYDLVELRFFLGQLSIGLSNSIVDIDDWNKAKKALVKKYSRSGIIDICKKIILEFQDLQPERIYINDFEMFIKESRLEEFYVDSKETIFVSTIHKAKGKEFDNVFLLLESFNLTSDERKRQLYVAMTRAKSNLTVHINRNYLNFIKADNLIRALDTSHHELPGKLAMQLSHRDVWLDYFSSRQSLIDTLQSGDILQYKNNECFTDEGKSILKFSKLFTERLDRVRKTGYEPLYAKINFIVYWRKEAAEREIKIVLPELHFERNKSERHLNQV